MDLNSLQSIAENLLNNLDFAWTFLLLSTRYMVFFMLVPGIGGGMMGMGLRYPATIAMAVVSVNPQLLANVPAHAGELAFQVIAEVILGACIGIVPLLIVAGAQVAGHLASGTMGLNGAQLFDPTTQTQLSDLSRIYSDLAVIIFLLLGGHYFIIAELAGLNSEFRPGMFVLSERGLEVLLVQSARLLQTGCLMAAPVVVALLLTNFVMGMISKVIPSLNIFIVSFPLTIGVGLVISVMALPEAAHLLEREFNFIPEVVARIVR